MTRRELLLSAAAAAREPEVMTVRGPVAMSKLGPALAHEHLFSNFGGPPEDPPTYNEARVLEVVTPYVKARYSDGCRAIFDATTFNFGRAPLLLRKISTQTGMHVITNTGWYGAAQGRYRPALAQTESADRIAALWLAEWRHGIGSTGIRPGFIKCGVDLEPLSDINAKLIRAAALLHRDSGLTITVHTGDFAPSAERQLAILKEEGVSPSAWVWIHASQCKEETELWRAAERGAWLCFDNVAPANLTKLLYLLRNAKQRKLLGRVLLSHDGNSYRWQEQPMKPYDYEFTGFQRELKSIDFTAEDWRLLTVQNPAEAYAVRVRS